MSATAEQRVMTAHLVEFSVATEDEHGDPEPGYTGRALRAAARWMNANPSVALLGAQTNYDDGDGWTLTLVVQGAWEEGTLDAQARKSLVDGPTEVAT